VGPLSTVVGAEIGGVDLAMPLAEPALAEIRRAFGEYGVVFFRDQLLTPRRTDAITSSHNPRSLTPRQIDEIQPTLPCTETVQVRSRPENCGRSRCC
jgi:alpha-ketoglutarate-dependent taurine dioxygenase